VTTMSGLDARFLFSETQAVRMHTLKVAVLDLTGRSTPLTRERLLEALDARLGRMPLLRRRVVPVPLGLGNPSVVDDPQFDLRRHVAWATLPPPGDARQLDEFIARTATTPLPDDRPLWQLSAVDGLADGQVALVAKIHHALADGTAAVQLLMNAFVLEDADAVVEPYRPDSIPSTAALYRSAAREAFSAAGSVPGLLRSTVEGMRNGLRARRDVDTPVFGPFAGPRTSFNVSLTADRTFASFALPISVMADAKDALGVSLNDVFLEVCAGGIRRYLDRLGQSLLPTLVASVPVATAVTRQGLGGNHVDNLFVPLHTDIDDPEGRARAIHASVTAARRVREAHGTDLFERRAGLVPPAIYSASTRAWAASRLADRLRPPVNLVASNVRGPRQRLELDGGVITALYSSGPILEGIGLNITAWSYVDTLYVTLLGCSQSLPDPWALADDIVAEMEHLSRAISRDAART
jgi:diacylglycerol O-acyltransferase / wax synthase